MNQNFINYATSIAFQIQLTKAQIRALVVISSPVNSRSQLHLVQGKSYDALLSKGLLERNENGALALSKPGKLVLALLKEANLLEYDRRQLLTTKFVEDLHKELVQ